MLITKGAKNKNNRELLHVSRPFQDNGALSPISHFIEFIHICLKYKNSIIFLTNGIA